MQEQRDDPDVGLVWIGFSPPGPLAGLARHLGWTAPVLADEQRRVYQALRLGRAPVWRAYSPGTLLRYARAAASGTSIRRPVEDTRQLGADAVAVDGVVRNLWRPRTPDDRPDVAEVLATAREHLGR